MYDTEEGCLSLLGGLRPCKRYKLIKVKYQTLELQTRIKTYTGTMVLAVKSTAMPMMSTSPAIRTAWGTIRARTSV